VIIIVVSTRYRDHSYFTNECVTAVVGIKAILTLLLVGVDRLVDEFIFQFTHTTEIDYLLPGIPPTGKKVEIPMIGVIAFRGDKLTFE
jgi:carboxymethylenebutenolidase